MFVTSQHVEEGVYLNLLVHLYSRGKPDLKAGEVLGVPGELVHQVNLHGTARLPTGS